MKIIDEQGRLFSKINTIDLLIILFLCGLIPAFYAGYKILATKPLELKLKESVPYRKQLNELDNIKDSLKQFIDFIDSQKTKLKETETTLNELKEEKEKLRPVVESDRKVAEAILELQAKRNRANIWKERAIGSLLAVLFTSIYLSSKRLILSLIKKFRN